MATIDKLEALEKAATAGPFTMMGPRNDQTATVEYEHVCLVVTPTKRGRVMIPAICDDEHNARLIAAARNALPALLAVAKAAKGLRATYHDVNWCPTSEREVEALSQALNDRAKYAAELDAAFSRLEAQ